MIAHQCQRHNWYQPHGTHFSNLCYFLSLCIFRLNGQSMLANRLLPLQPTYPTGLPFIVQAKWAIWLLILILQPFLTHAGTPCGQILSLQPNLQSSILSNNSNTSMKMQLYNRVGERSSKALGLFVLFSRLPTEIRQMICRLSPNLALSTSESETNAEEI